MQFFGEPKLRQIMMIFPSIVIVLFFFIGKDCRYDDDLNPFRKCNLKSYVYLYALQDICVNMVHASLSIMTSFFFFRFASFRFVSVCFARMHMCFSAYGKCNRYRTIS